MDSTPPQYTAIKTSSEDSNLNSGKIGIDLGTTYCCCAVVKSDQLKAVVDFVPYSDGKKSLAAHVFYNPKQKEIVAGNAVRYTTKSVDHTVFDSKRFIGKTYDKELEEDMKMWPFKVINDNGIPKVEMLYNNETIYLTANEISTEILKAIKSRADEFLGQNNKKITQAVITVPAYFKQQQREETKKAAEAANLKVIQILNEPTSAAIAYTYQRLLNNDSLKGIRTLLIYDFGGGTFDISIIRLNYERKSVKVLATDGDSHLGGDDIDRCIYNHFLKKYQEKTGKPIDNLPSKKLVKLRKASEEVKISLSFGDTATLNCDWLDDCEIDMAITRSMFSNICREIFEKTVRIVENALKSSGLEIENITDVVLSGGSSRIPMVKENLKNKFPTATLCQDINPDEIVAQGAAIVANMDGFNFTVSDVLTHTLSTDVETGKIYEMLVKNTVLPCYATTTFANANANQKYIDVNVYEGDGDDISYEDDHNVKRLNQMIAKLGYFKFDGITVPNKPQEIQLTVTFAVNLDGILTVSAVENKSGVEKTLTLSLK